MILSEIFSSSDKRTLIALHAKKRKKQNPIESKTTSKNSFIDVFGGMVGYSTVDQSGSVSPN